MAFKLKKGIFKVTCKHSGCPFSYEVSVTQNIMGVTEDDVLTEAIKIARDIAKIKHDSIHGRTHELTSPVIKKVSGVYESIGAPKSSIVNQDEAIKYKEYKKGEKILQKGEIAATICEIVKGTAYVDTNSSKYYNVGDSFGAAALLVNQTRTADVIAGEDNTSVAFYNLKELNKKDPRKAKELYTEAMEDVFKILTDLEQLISELEENLEKTSMISENRKERIKELESQLIDANRKISQLNDK